MAAKIKFSAAESAHYLFAMFSIQAQKKVSSYNENDQEQRADDPLSDLIICDHPLPKITKIIKKQERWSTRGFKALSLLQVRWIKQGSLKYDLILNNKEKILQN